MDLFKTGQIHFHHVHYTVLENFAGTYFRGFEQNREN